MIGDNAPKGTHDQHGYPDMHSQFHVFHMHSKLRGDHLSGTGDWPETISGIPDRWPYLARRGQPFSVGEFKHNIFEWLDKGPFKPGGKVPVTAYAINPELLMPF